MLTQGPAVPSGESTAIRWSNETLPLQRAVMDAGDDSRWSRVYVQASPQGFGKTDVCINALQKAAHWDASDSLYINASDAVCRRMWTNKIEPAFRALDANEPDPVRRMLHENTDLGGSHELRKFTNGARMAFTGARSSGDLSGMTLRIIVFDDVHTMPPDVAGQGHPVEYGIHRLSAFSTADTTAYIIGTAQGEENYLWRSLCQSAFFVPYLPCLKCGWWQILELERFVYDPDDPTVPDCWMRCANDSCDHKIRDNELPEMLRRHQWVSTPPGANVVLEPGPRSGLQTLDGEAVYPHTKRKTDWAGFWANKLYWPFRQWREYVAERMSSAGDPDRAKVFRQNIENRPWIPPEEDSDILRIEELDRRERSESHRVDTVPGEADIVITAVDLQSGYCYAVHRAWKRSTGDSWLVRARTYGKKISVRQNVDQNAERVRKAAVMRGLEELREVCDSGFDVVDASGEITGKRPSDLVVIDSAHWGDVAHAFALRAGMDRYRLIVGTTPQQRRSSKVPLWQRNPRPSKKTGRVVHEINKNSAKHLVRLCLRVPPGDPGYWREPEGCSLKAYHEHLTRERWDGEKGKWVPITKGSQRHDYFDCEGYGIAAAYGCGVQIPGHEPPPPAKAKGATTYQRRVRRRNVRRVY